MAARLTIAVVSPAASTNYTILAGEVSYALPAADIDYISLVTATKLDYTGLYRFVAEAVVVSEGQQFTLAKLRTDTISAVDSASLAFSRSATDSFATSDFSTVQTQKGLSDTVALGSSAAFDFTKGPTQDSLLLQDSDTLDVARRAFDEVWVADATAFSTTKPLSDTTSVTEAAEKGFVKPVADGLSIFDAPVLDLSKPLTDSFIISEVSTFELSKPVHDTVAAEEASSYQFSKPLQDALSVPDDATLDVGKGLADETFVTDILTPTLIYVRYFDDAFALNDNFGAGDGIAFVWERTVANVALLSDNATILVSPVLSDAFSVSESFGLVSQGYCDPTYFAEDYVGDSRYL